MSADPAMGTRGEPTPPPPPPTGLTPEVIISAYLANRVAIEQLSAKHKEEMKPLNERAELCETWLLNYLNASGGQNFASDKGTAFKKLVTSISTADKMAFLNYALRPAAEAMLDALHLPPGVEVDRDAFAGALIENLPLDLMDISANKTGVTKLLDEAKIAAPGVTITRVHVVQVRKKS